MEAPRLFVVKKDGRREQYNRDKVLTGLQRSCEKRPVSQAQMEAVVGAPGPPPGGPGVGRGGAPPGAKVYRFPLT